MPGLKQVISIGVLKELAGNAAFERGEHYFEEGVVNRMRDEASKVTARVAGTENYRVELWNDDGELGGRLFLPACRRRLFLQALRCGRIGLA